MKILFIYRDKHFTNHSFKKIFERNLCKVDFGFFLLSLKTISNIRLISLNDFLKYEHQIEYDHVVIDSKIRLDHKEKEYILPLKTLIKTKVSIFLSYDRPVNNDDIYYFENYLEVNSYFVPNLLKDFDTYQIDINIKNKLYQTHYGLGFTEISYDLSKRKFSTNNNFNNYDYNVFYSGDKRKGKFIRTKIIEDLLKNKNIKNMNINYYEEKDRDKYILGMKDYIEAIQKSKINLVLAGNANNITYRLYEVLFFKSFFLVDPHFTNFKISENFNSTADFVFYNSGDLIDKINFYLNNYEKADLIRKMQSKSFEKIYDPYEHGNFLKNIIIT